MKGKCKGILIAECIQGMVEGTLYTGVCLYGNGVPLNYPIILQLVTGSFWEDTPSPSHNTFTSPMSFLGGVP